MAAGLTQTTKNSFDLLLKAGKMICHIVKMNISGSSIYDSYQSSVCVRVDYFTEVKSVEVKPGSEQQQKENSLPVVILSLFCRQVT